MTRTPVADQRGEQILASYVSPDYSKTMEIPVLRGRAFVGGELHAGNLSPAVINIAMATRFWPSQNPVGKEFLAGQDRRYQVIGIVSNVSTLHLGQEDGRLFYGLMADSAGAVDAKMFLCKTGNASAAVSAIPALVRQIDPNLTVTTEPYLQVLSEQLLPARRGAILVSALGLLALLLAVVGVSGVVSLAASQRVRETCIRIALGARSRDVIGSASWTSGETCRHRTRRRTWPRGRIWFSAGQQWAAFWCQPD
jgi:MacB-like periplasmic core domain